MNMQFSKMTHRELIRVNINSLKNRSEVQAYFVEIGERRRKLKMELTQYDDIIRNLQVILTRV